MSKTIQAIRGMNDILPEAAHRWQFLETTLQELLASYGYQEIRLPVVEQTELFARAIGTVTDIVEKEMYTFLDRNGDSLTLRPEGTAGCVRAAIENGLLYSKVQRFWYSGPMFRHERPQKGRYRQFHQVGVETFGMDGPDIDAELILLTARLWRALGLKNLELQLNSLGSASARAAHREQLVCYFSKYLNDLDADSQRRLHTNPLRILDSKNPALQTLIGKAPQLADYLDGDSEAHFAALCAQLDAAGVVYKVNPRLVRGLDYYNKTVFEWVSNELGAQGTVCAGGRYDALVEQIGGKPTAAVGFAAGLERLVLLLEVAGSTPQTYPHAYLVMAGEEASRKGLLLAETLRDDVTGLRLVTDCTGGSFKGQMKRADKSGAKFALILGEQELTQGVITVKPLRENTEQFSIQKSALASFLASNI